MTDQAPVVELDDLVDADAPELSPVEASQRQHRELLESLPRPKHAYIEARKLKLDALLNPAEAASQKWVDFYTATFIEQLADGFRVFPDGRGFAIGDGRHRYLALKARGEEYRKVGCYVYEDCTPAQRAAVYSYFNEWRRKMTPKERFHGMVMAEDPTTLSAAKVLDELGLQVTAYTALRNAIERSPNLDEAELQLKWVLRTLDNAWPTDSSRFNAVLIHGLSRFYTKYVDDPNFDVDGFSERIIRGRMSALQVVAHTTQTSRSTGVGAQRVAEEWFLARHDAGRTTRRLVSRD